jgi:hypothetical protein
VIGKNVFIPLFAAGVIHLIGRVREGMQRFTYDDAIHDSILDDTEPAPKPYSRMVAGAALILGLLACFGVGLLIGSQMQYLAAQMPHLFSRELHLEALLYPPIFVLFVDLVRVFALRVDG